MEVSTQVEGNGKANLDGLRVLALIPHSENRRILSAYLSAASVQVTHAADWQAFMHRESINSEDDRGNKTILLIDLSDEQLASDWAQYRRALSDRPTLVCLRREQYEQDYAVWIQDWLKCDTHHFVWTEPLFLDELQQALGLTAGRIVAKQVPVEKGSDPESAMNYVTVNETTQAPLILLAEDNETNREVMLEQLSILGYTVEAAENGLIALEMWRSGRYALLLTDCHMPEMDGFALTEAIRATGPKGEQFPIIAVTANALQGEADRCRARGMNDYLSKPLRLRELGQMLRKWLPQSIEQAHTFNKQPEASASTSTVSFKVPETNSLPVWDPSTLTEVVGDNPALHQRLLTKFQAKSNDQIQEIQTAVDLCDGTRIADQAHILKSAARTVGALALGDLCQKLETAGRAQQIAQCVLLSAQLEDAYMQVKALMLQANSQQS